jgi:ketosteroid isomerase-like protein
MTDQATVTDSAALESNLQQLDASIDALASNGDFDALGDLLAADFRYNHSTGLAQNKSEWLEGLKPLVGRRERVASAIKIEVHGDLAVAMGDLDIVWTDGRHNYDRYVRIYRLAEGKWLAVSQRTVPAHDRAPGG